MGAGNTFPVPVPHSTTCDISSINILALSEASHGRGWRRLRPTANSKVERIKNPPNQCNSKAGNPSKEKRTIRSTAKSGAPKINLYFIFPYSIKYRINSISDWAGKSGSAI